MKRFGKGLLKFLVQVVIVTCLVMFVHVCVKGMYLVDIPKQADVERVTLTYTGARNPTRERTEERDIDLAVKLTGFLKYDLFRKAAPGSDPLATIVYHLKDGREITVSASRDTVWWQGKARALKEPETFLNLLEGIFFQPEVYSYMPEAVEP